MSRERVRNERKKIGSKGGELGGLFTLKRKTSSGTQKERGHHVIGPPAFLLSVGRKGRVVQEASKSEKGMNRQRAGWSKFIGSSGSPIEGTMESR